MINRILGIKGVGAQITAGADFNLDAGNSASYSGSGTAWLDLTANNEDNTLQNGVGFSSSNGGVLTFANASQQHSTFDLTTTLINTGSAFTIEAWVLQDSKVSFDTIISLKTNTTHPFNVAFVPVAAFGTYGHVTFGSASGWTTVKNTSIAVPISNWYQIIITYNGGGTTTLGNYTMHVNNVLATTGTAGAFGAANNISSIGHEMGTAFYLDGKFSVANLYPFVLSAPEKTNNFDFYKNRFGL